MRVPRGLVAAFAAAFLAAVVAAISVIVVAPESRKALYQSIARRVDRALGRDGVPAERIAEYVQRYGIDAAALPARGPATGPLRVSAANPRYFADPNGRIVYLAGAHTWLNLQDGGRTDPPQRFDYATWLRFLESQGHNFFRLWTWEQPRWSVEDPGEYFLAPSVFRRASSGPMALDGKPRFDLEHFDDAFFQRLRERVIVARDHGFYVSIMLFNGFSVAYPKGPARHRNPWLAHPNNLANNIQQVNGDVDGDGSGEEVHELADPRVTALQEAYVRRLVDSVNDLDNVLFEISNESHARSAAWQRHMIDFIHRHEAGKPKQHPVGMTALWPGGDNAGLEASNADWISPDGSVDFPTSADGRHVIVADTDHMCGVCGGSRRWVWESFTRGRNLLMMDRYDGAFPLPDEINPYDLLDQPKHADVRRNLGFARRLSQRIDLEKLVPHGELADSGYVLAHPAASGAEYVVYVPEGGTRVDLTAAAGPLSVEWLDPSSGMLRDAPGVMGGRVLRFTPPFKSDAVLHLRHARLR